MVLLQGMRLDESLRMIQEEQSQQSQQNQEADQVTSLGGKQVIQVIQEFPVIHKEIVETGKVHIRKTVTEETASVHLPIFNESYHIERVAVNKVQDEPPPAVRYEGDKMIIAVLREVTVIKKRYEIIEELHITKSITETPVVQEITLLKENIHIERTGTNQKE